MAVRSCRVTITDADGVGRSANVTASTLYEAVALGLKALRGDEWVGGLSEECGTVRVPVNPVPVEHTVSLRDFNNWLQRAGGRSPAEVSARNRVLEILGSRD